MRDRAYLIKKLFEMPSLSVQTEVKKCSFFTFEDESQKKIMDRFESAFVSMLTSQANFQPKNRTSEDPSFKHELKCIDIHKPTASAGVLRTPRCRARISC